MLTERDDVIDYLNMADMFYANESYEHVVWCLNAVLQLDPDNVSAFKRLARIEIRMTRYDKACEYLMKIKDQLPDDKEIDVLIRKLKLNMAMGKQKKIKGNVK